jgi:hypothetical protein
MRVRTPAALANLLPAFWRSSLRTTSDREALAAARIVRAALDTGFRAVEAGMQSGTMSAEQAEAVIAAVGRRALASAEALRALAGPRPEAAILAAQRAHAAEAEAWRGVLRRNELGAVLPLLAAAAAESGLDELAERPGPDLLREAARMLAVVAEENARREDGLYAGDRDQMLSRLASHEAPSRAVLRSSRTHQAPLPHRRSSRKARRRDASSSSTGAVRRHGRPPWRPIKASHRCSPARFRRLKTWLVGGRPLSFRSRRTPTSVWAVTAPRQSRRPGLLRFRCPKVPLDCLLRAHLWIRRNNYGRNR